MNIYPINISSPHDMKAVCSIIGTDPRALSYLVPKSRIFHIFADNVDFRAAGFLKQEMLSRGGDVAVTKHVIDGKTEKSDILIMATHSQLRNLQEKLKAMDCWGLKEFREKLAGIMKAVNIHEWQMISPSGHTINFSLDTKLMAIINLTPDSFFAESRTDEANILSRAEKFLSDGAYILDVGAESTRPGAESVSLSEEIDRLVPALRILRKEFPDAIISVDTYKPEVAKISANEGADIINDISGFTFSEYAGMPKVIAELKIPYVLSHIRGNPANMAMHEPYENIINELAGYFAEKIAALENVGVNREQIIIDPGIGFGKESADNFAVLKNVESLKIFGRPILIGHSRKRFTGTERLAGTLGVSALMAGRVSLLRVHDVKENVEAIRIARGINDA